MLSFEALIERGLVAQQTHAVELAARLQRGLTKFYCGFDPTADSLHLGHLIPILVLRHLQALGHQPVVLLGGATGLIGDPSFKASERNLLPEDTISEWAESIRKQLLPFLDFEVKLNPALILNNYTWFGPMDLLGFLRRVGKHFSVNAMLQRESVKQRLSRPESGISFTEFTYSLLQAYDFVALYNQYGVELQIGGSDQWGNIVAGIELGRRVYQANLYGLTVPLITRSNGQKFGKTEQGTIWLSPKKTSPYAFYQFWKQVSDQDAYRFLQLFTSMPLKAIQELELSDQQGSGASEASQILAREMTGLVHGQSGLEIAERLTNLLFRSEVKELTEADFLQLANGGIPVVAYNEGMELTDALSQLNLVPSRSKARELISAGAIRVNGQRRLHRLFEPNDRRYGSYTLLQRGARTYGLVTYASIAPPA